MCVSKIKNHFFHSQPKGHCHWWILKRQKTRLTTQKCLSYIRITLKTTIYSVLRH